MKDALSIDAEGRLPLPWLAEPLLQALHQQRGHALLLHAAPGIGALAFAVSLAQSWLCEAQALVRGDPAAPVAQLACGRCASCKLFHSRLHPDFFLLLPEALRQEHGWPLPGDKADSAEGGSGGSSKRKPSRQVRIDEVRAMVDWSTLSNSRGRAKVLVIHPAETMNLQSANALLKTLEEPPAGTRLLLSAADPSALLPTLRSRCQHLRLPVPTAQQAQVWLQSQGVAAPAAMLAACSGRPLDVLNWAAAGLDAKSWAALPQAVAGGQAQALAGWPVPLMLDALQKVCHDALAMSQGAAPRFFAAAQMPEGADPQRLSAWSETLARTARNAGHPWNEGLLCEALVSAGASAWADAARPAQAGARPAVLPAVAITRR